jgi:hypothetical protein
MSEVSGAGGAAASGRDPVVRFLLGCGAVVAIVIALLVVVALVVGWQLTRDESPGRGTEALLIGDESRYWRVDLTPDDPGLVALFHRFEEINESARAEALRGTILESLPLPRRQAALGEIAPFTIELGVTPSDAWSARGTFGHGVLKLRLGLHMMRFLFKRDSTRAESVDVDGVTVTEIHDAKNRFAFGTVGNRLLVTSDLSRMRSILAGHAEAADRARDEVTALHDGIRLDGEDAWAFVRDLEVGEPAAPASIHAAAASFDVDDRDELRFRIAVAPATAAPERRPFGGSAGDRLALASAFLPGVPEDAITLDDDAPPAAGGGMRTFSGRIERLSSRFGELLSPTGGVRLRDRIRRSLEPQSPSASPSPPSPRSSSDPRSGIPAGPPRGGTPTPRR